jgi:DNA primase
VAWRGWEEEVPFQRNEATKCQPTIAVQLLENGGKIEPYTIIIMATGIYWLMRSVLVFVGAWWPHPITMKKVFPFLKKQQCNAMQCYKNG